MPKKKRGSIIAKCGNKSAHTSDHLRHAQVNVQEHVLLVAALLHHDQWNHFSAREEEEEMKDISKHEKDESC